MAKRKPLVKGSLAAKRYMAKLRRLAVAARKSGARKNPAKGSRRANLKRHPGGGAISYSGEPGRVFATYRGQVTGPYVSIQAAFDLLTNTWSKAAGKFVATPPRRYLVGGKRRTETLEDAKALAQRIFEKTGSIVSIEETGAKRPQLPSPAMVEVKVWEERDRLHIELRHKFTGNTIAEWWDDDARQMFEDGFFKSGRDLDRSVIEYAQEMGLLANGNPAGMRPGYREFVKTLPVEGLQSQRQALLRSLEKDPMNPKAGSWTQAVGILSAELDRRGVKTNPLTKRESHAILDRATKSIRDAGSMAGNHNLNRLRSEKAAYGAGLADAVSIAGPKDYRRHASKIVDASRAVIRGEEQPFSELFGRPLRQFNPLIMTVMGNPYSLKGGDKQGIRNIVSRLSVGATEAEAADAVVAKLAVHAPAHVITAVRNYAAQCHRANQRLAGGVARGMNPGAWLVYKDGRQVAGGSFPTEIAAWAFVKKEKSGGMIGSSEVWRVYPESIKTFWDRADGKRWNHNPAKCSNPGHRHGGKSAIIGRSDAVPWSQLTEGERAEVLKQSEQSFGVEFTSQPGLRWQKRYGLWEFFGSAPRPDPRRNPLDYQDVYAAAQKVGYSIIDASRVASAFKRTGELPRTVEAQLRYFRNPGHMQFPLTVPRRGWEVLAREHLGMLSPYLYANRTQAQAKANELGDGWELLHWGRPWYVGRKSMSSPPTNPMRNPWKSAEMVASVQDGHAIKAFHAYGMTPAAKREWLRRQRADGRLAGAAVLRNPRKKGTYLMTGDDPGRGPWAATYKSAKELLDSIRATVIEEVNEYIANVKEAGEEESDYDYDNAVEFKDMLEGRTPFDFRALEDMLRAWKSTDSNCEIENIFDNYGQNPLTRGEAAQSLRMARHSIRTARRASSPLQRASLVGTALGASEVVRRHGPAQAKRVAGTFQSRTLASKNPGKGTRRKVTMTLEAFAKMVKAKNDPKLWSAFLKKIEAYKKWSHGTLPKKVTVEQIDVPGMSGMWMTYDAGKAPETAYVMPRGTKRKGAWVHQWDTMPDLKNDPDSGIVLTKLKGKSRITDFYHR